MYIISVVREGILYDASCTVYMLGVKHGLVQSSD